MTGAQKQRMSQLLDDFTQSCKAGDLSAYIPIGQPPFTKGEGYNLTRSLSDTPKDFVSIDWLGAGFVFSHNGQCYA